MSGDEPVTSPDQHKPTNRKLTYAGAIVCGAIIVIMGLANIGGANEGHVETIWLLGIGIAMMLSVVVDYVLRRNGLRNG